MNTPEQLFNVAQQTPEIQLLLEISSPHPDKMHLDKLLKNIQIWENTIPILNRNNTIPLFLEVADNELLAKYIAAPFIQQLKNRRAKQVGQNMALNAVFKNICNVLKEANIPFIVLKGMYLSNAIYEKPYLRPMCDIDLLIHPENRTKACNTLLALGCSMPTYSQSSYIDSLKRHLPPFYFKGQMIELHLRLSPEFDTVQIGNERVWQNTTITTLHENEVQILSYEYHLLFMCTHVYRHLQGGELKLIWYSDIARFIEKFSSAINWAHFQLITNEANAQTAVHHSLQTTCLFYQISVPFAITLKSYDIEPVIQIIEKGKNSAARLYYIDNFINIKGLANKLKYLSGRLFPSTNYIKAKYKTNEISIFKGYYIEYQKIGRECFLILKWKVKNFGVK